MSALQIPQEYSLYKVLRALLIPLFALAFSSLSAEEGPSHLMLGTGIFSVDKGTRSVLFQAEYRWELDCYHVRPLLSGLVTTNRSYYFCCGAAYDIFLGTKKLVLTPSFAPGVYHRGKGKNLGFPINFRSSLELSYVFDNQGRFGAQFYHISNAHLSKKNPGSDQLVFSYSIPIWEKKKK